MDGYSQPPGYRFSHDSVELAQRIAAFLRQLAGDSSEPLQVLDVCSGSGVVGLEVARYAGRALSIDFNEIQPDYLPHFEKNLRWIQTFAPSLKGTFKQANYESLLRPDLSEAYDVVVSNPPYFDRGQGKLPPSLFKARARFFLDASFESMCDVFAHVLRPKGHCFFLVRDLSDHGLDRVESLNRTLAPFGVWQALEPVRGTEFVHFVKNSRN